MDDEDLKKYGEILFNILISIFKNDDENRSELKNFLIQCFFNSVIVPRYDFIATLDILYERMTDDYDKKDIDALKIQTTNWILGPDNKKFTRIYWPNEGNKKIPKIIKDFFNKIIKEDINKLLKIYMSPKTEEDQEQLQEDIEYRKKSYISTWLKPNTEKKMNITFLQKKIRESGRESEEVFRKPEFKKDTEIIPLNMTSKQLKEAKKMEEAQKKIELYSMEGIDPVKKTDKEKFNEIFKVFEDKGVNITIPMRKKIENLWYGDYYSNQDSNDILSIVRMNNISIKIKNQMITSQTSRIILQTYIVGLIYNKDIFDIYSVINKITSINPNLIHDGKAPTSEIQKVLDIIISKIYLEDEFSMIRTNWEKMKYPKIDTGDLINYINEEEHLDKPIKFSIMSNISHLKKNIPIKHYAREVHNIIKKKANIITEKQILELLKYH